MGPPYNRFIFYRKGKAIIRFPKLTGHYDNLWPYIVSLHGPPICLYWPVTRSNCNDITNGVYGHRSVEELRAQIEKIKLPYE